MFDSPLLPQAVATKAVVFDLGGVLIDLHSEEAGCQLMEQYGLSPNSFARLTRSCFELQPSSITELAMLGKIETSTYLEAFLRECRVKDAERVRANRLSVVGRERKDVLTIVEQLKQAGLKCCVLSNTIALHWERLSSAREYPCLGLFEHVFASHLIGVAKPQKQAFSFVANALKVQMSECLLVDDTVLNIEGAKAAGWRGILFASAAKLQQDVSDLLQAPKQLLLVRPAMEFRAGSPADAEAIAGLIASFQSELTDDPSGAGAEEYLASVSLQAEREYLASERYRYLLAYSDSQLAGFIAIRDGVHLFHLFVERAHQRQGVARRLWERALRELCAPSNEGDITVNSSLSAVPVYQAFGFVPAGPIQSMHGISFLPMRRPAVQHGA